jgi:hypothetical protein
VRAYQDLWPLAAVAAGLGRWQWSAWLSGAGSTGAPLIAAGDRLSRIAETTLVDTRAALPRAEFDREFTAGRDAELDEIAALAATASAAWTGRLVDA